ncbi:hypothetical protein BK127_26880 [Paenibacillus sp. FSL H7-0331]|nr:hypothetical protein BK127_26880 [Paenibacillus sp. FSL H7-0331]
MFGSKSTKAATSYNTVFTLRPDGLGLQEGFRKSVISKQCSLPNRIKAGPTDLKAIRKFVKNIIEQLDSQNLFSNQNYKEYQHLELHQNHRVLLLVL